MAAPSNATLFIETAWNPGFGAALYKVYRSFNPVGPFTQIAEVTSTVYDDADPTLSPGVTVNYQVSAVNTAGETRTSALGVTPLSAFNVLLSSPGDNAVGVSTIPTFAWSFSPAGAAQHCYDISVQGVTILGPVNLVSTMALQASQLYARNVLSLLLHLYDQKAGRLSLDPADEIVKGCLIAHAGEVLQPV